MLSMMITMVASFKLAISFSTHKLLNKDNGCLVFKVTPDEFSPHKFTVYEEFVNQAGVNVRNVVSVNLQICTPTGRG